MSKKSKHRKDNPLAQPHSEGGEEKSTNRNVYIKSGVTIDLVEDLKQQQITARKENTTHQNKQLFWTKVAAGLLLLTAGFSFWQGYSAKRTTDLFQQSERPYLWNATVKPRPMVAGQQISADIFLVNYGKSPALDVYGRGQVFFGPDALKQADDWFKSLGEGPLNRAVGTITTLPPGIPSDPLKATFFTTSHSDRLATQDDINYIIVHDFSAVIVMRTEYSDSHGYVYYSDMCFFRFASSAIGQCHEHNTMH